MRFGIRKIDQSSDSLDIALGMDVNHDFVVLSHSFRETDWICVRRDGSLLYRIRSEE